MMQKMFHQQFSFFVFVKICISIQLYYLYTEKWKIKSIFRRTRDKKIEMKLIFLNEISIYPSKETRIDLIKLYNSKFVCFYSSESTGLNKKASVWRFRFLAILFITWNSLHSKYYVFLIRDINQKIVH